MEMGTLIFDIDGTICTQESNYALAKPFTEVIKKINNKYNEGYKIILYTARGTETMIDWRAITEQQLKKWGVKYHELKFGKPAADLYIDDKAVPANNWEPTIKYQAAIKKIWGTEYLLSKTDKYAFKRLELLEGKSISKQYHLKKHETWHIVEGTGWALLNDQIIEVTPGDTFVINPGEVHQIIALSKKLVIMEASTPELEDIVRIQKEFDVKCNKKFM